MHVLDLAVDVEFSMITLFFVGILPVLLLSLGNVRPVELLPIVVFDLRAGLVLVRAVFRDLLAHYYVWIPNPRLRVLVSELR